MPMDNPFVSALQGISAGMAGKAFEFDQAQQQKLEQQRQEMAQSKAIGGRIMLNAINAGKWDDAKQFLHEAIRNGGRDDQEMLTLATMFETGNKDQIKNALQMNDERSVLMGLIPEIKTAEQEDASKGYQFGATETYKDSEGNLFTATQKRNPANGQVEQVVVPIDRNVKEPKGKLQEVGTYGLTAQEKLAQLGGEENVKQSAKIINEYKEQGLKARGLMRDTKRLLELNKLISTGKTAPAKKAFMNLFNIKDESAANLGEFNSKAGALVLGMIKQLGANPTEGERAFLKEISPSIESGSAVNEALLNDLLRVQERQVARAKWLAKNPGADINDLLLMTEEFRPTEQESTASTTGKIDYSTMSDDEFIKSLGN